MKTLYEINSENKSHTLSCIRSMLVALNPDATFISFTVNAQGYEHDVKNRGIPVEESVSMRNVSGNWIQKF